MAKKQTIILTHGSGAPVYSKDNYKKGEVLVRHAGDDKDAALYTANNDEDGWIEFPSKAYVDAIDEKITSADGISSKITALDGRLGTAESEIDALQAADTTIRGEFAAADTQIRTDFAAADTQIRTDFAAADTALKTELEGKISAVEADVETIEKDYLKAADKTELSNAINGVSGRVETIEKDYLKAADKTELSNAITNLKNNEVKANTDAIDAIEADYLKAADKQDLLDKITEAQNAATTKVEGSDYITVTPSVDNETNSTTYNVTISNKVATAESLKSATDRLDAIEGTDKGVSMRTVAKAEVDAFKNLLYGEGTADVIDTLQDVINWIDSDESGATKIVADIAELQKVTSGYEGEKAIQNAVNGIDGRLGTAEGEIDALQAADTALETAYKAADNQIRTDFAAADTQLDTKLTAEINKKANTQTVNGINTRLEDVEEAYVKTAVVTNTETNKITASVASNTLTLNFDSMVIDGGEY